MQIEYAAKLIKLRTPSGIEYYFEHILFNTDPHTNETICEYAELSDTAWLNMDTSKAETVYLSSWESKCECGSDTLNSPWHSWYCPKFSGHP